jgi:hypothetical protein
MPAVSAMFFETIPAIGLDQSASMRHRLVERGW